MLSLFNKDRLIKIRYDDFNSEFTKLYEINKARYDAYIKTNNIEGLKEQRERIKGHLDTFHCLINSHTDQFPTRELLNGLENDQTKINKLLVDIRNKFIEIEENITNYIYKSN